jgi:hypothetical protein
MARHVGRIVFGASRTDLVDPGWELLVALFQTLDQTIDLFLACSFRQRQPLSALNKWATCTSSNSISPGINTKMSPRGRSR